MMTESKIARSMQFLEYLVEWEEGLAARDLEAIVAEAGGPQHVALVCVDLLEGFTREGPLSHPRVAALIAPIVRTVERAHKLGVRDFVFLQDAHPADSPEFGAYPPHCVEGTREAEMVDELKALPFASSFTVLRKRSIDSAMGTELSAWLDVHGGIRRIVAVGDCTDLCLYELAVYLKVRANVHRHAYEVVVPADCADTYDLPVETARGLGAMPHDGDLLHRVFLYQMALNGIQVVRTLE